MGTACLSLKRNVIAAPQTSAAIHTSHNHMQISCKAHLKLVSIVSKQSKLTVSIGMLCVGMPGKPTAIHHPAALPNLETSTLQERYTPEFCYIHSISSQHVLHMHQLYRILANLLCVAAIGFCLTASSMNQCPFHSG